MGARSPKRRLGVTVSASGLALSLIAGGLLAGLPAQADSVTTSVAPAIAADEVISITDSMATLTDSAVTIAWPDREKALAEETGTPAEPDVGAGDPSEPTETADATATAEPAATAEPSATAEPTETAESDKSAESSARAGSSENSASENPASEKESSTSEISATEVPESPSTGETSEPEPTEIASESPAAPSDVPTDAAETEKPATPAEESPDATTDPSDDPAPSETADPEPSNPNKDRLKDLTVTISQSESITNQGITVSWKGGVPTSSGQYASDYLQIMQCWGDETVGPTPEQCQWGTPNASISGLMGVNTAGRGLVNREDPKQTYGTDLLMPPPLTNPYLKAYAYPFTPVNDKKVFDVSTYFNAATSNEISAARTGADGTGSVVFEAYTSLQAPHLGCGANTTDASGKDAPRNCWLVVVPRGDRNADGSLGSDDATKRISGSPFSASNWENRFTFKLDFQPVSQNCPIGNAEQRLVGSEMISEAITSWQPALCGEGTTYGYSQIGDSEARRQITSGIQGASALAIVSKPLDSVPEDALIQYAPLAVSSVVIAFNIEYNIAGGSESPLFGKNGTQVQELKLNARLLAKLLTQSYRSDVPGQGTQSADLEKVALLGQNPFSIVVDPEFLALNPEFEEFSRLATPEGLLVSLGNSDANELVWNWVKADPSAKAFLQGRADEWGMQINPSYKSLDLGSSNPVDNFPKTDLETYREAESIPAPGFGTLDMRPYMNDMHEASVRARKADANVKTTWDPTKQPPAFISVGAQVPGERFMLAITDSASASRYGLQTATLVNSAKESVKPSQASMTGALETLTVSKADKSVLVNNQANTSPDAYPLTMVNYAAINVCAASTAMLEDYSTLLDYSIGSGQKVGDARGQLPRGYAPLKLIAAGPDGKIPTSTLLVRQNKAVSKGLVNAKSDCPVAEEPDPDPEPTPTEKPEPSETPAPIDPAAPITPPVDSSYDAGSTPVVPPAAAADPDTATSQPGAVAMDPTATTDISGARWVLLGALLLGLVGVLGGPVFTRRARQLENHS